MTDSEFFTCTECGEQFLSPDLPHSVYDCLAYLKNRVAQLENELRLARSNVPHPYNSHVVIERITPNSRLVIEKIPQLPDTIPPPSSGEKK